MRYLLSMIILFVMMLFTIVGLTRASEPVILPVVEDAYAKENWPTGGTVNIGYLSIGYNTLYPEKRTRTYLQFDLTGVNATFDKAELDLTYYSAGTQKRGVMIAYRVNAIDWDTLNWYNQPSTIGEPLYPTYTISGKQHYLDITKIIRDSISEGNGAYIRLSFEDELNNSIRYYSSECLPGSLFYQPYCTAGMGPKLILTYEEPLPQPILFSEYNRLYGLGALMLQWMAVDDPEVIDTVSISSEPDMSSSVTLSGSEGSVIWEPANSGRYYWQVVRSRIGREGEAVGSGVGVIDIIDISGFTPIISVTDDRLSVSKPPELNDEDPIDVVWHYGNTELEDSTLLLADACDGGGKITVNAQLSIGNTHSKLSSPVEIKCGLLNAPTPDIISDQPLDPPSDNVNTPPQQIYRIPKVVEQKIPSSNERVTRSTKQEQVKGVETSTDTEEARSLQPPVIVCMKSQKGNCNDLQIVRIQNIPAGKDLFWINIQLVDHTDKLGCELNDILCEIEDRICGERKRSTYAVLKVGGIELPIYQLSTGQSRTDLIFATRSNKAELPSTLDFVQVERSANRLCPTLRRSYTYQIDRIPPAISIPDPDDRRPYRFPFNNSVGVTQWHGMTAFSSPHTGIDFGVNLESVYTIGPGKIVGAGYDNYFGKCLSGGYYLTVEHPDKTHSVYMHLDSRAFQLFNWKIGDTVRKHQKIAVSGNSGSYNCQPLGYHLHLETRSSRRQDSHVDPVTKIRYDWDLVLTMHAEIYPGRLTGNNPHPGR